MGPKIGGKIFAYRGVKPVAITGLHLVVDLNDFIVWHFVLGCV